MTRSNEENRTQCDGDNYVSNKESCDCMKHFFRHVFFQQKQPNDIKNTLGTDVKKNIEYIQIRMNQAPDLVARTFQMHHSGEEAAICYLDNLVDARKIERNILHPLMYELEGDTNSKVPSTLSSLRLVQTWEAIQEALLSGNSVLMIQGHHEAQVFQTTKFPERQIQEPFTETSVHGPHVGFVETGKKNIALIRQYANNQDLKIEEFTVRGKVKNKLSVLYFKGQADTNVLHTLKDRLLKLRTNSVLTTGKLMESIEDNPYSPFPQLLVTERPDTVVAHLLKGRLCVVVDGSADVLIGPVSFPHFFQSADDDNARWLIVTFLRLLRFFGFFFATSLPALYIAVISFHPEVIPVELLLSIGKSRARVPLPPLMEALLMEMTIEMLREAALRLPARIGPTVAIVGGVIIGEAAVNVGVVSNIMVIVVASTALSSFIIPHYEMSSAIRFVRFPLMFIASLFGLVGIIVGWMTLIGHLISLTSLGIPYGAPFAPMRFSEWRDTVVRLPENRSNGDP